MISSYAGVISEIVSASLLTCGLVDIIMRVGQYGSLGLGSYLDSFVRHVHKGLSVFVVFESCALLVSEPSVFGRRLASAIKPFLLPPFTTLHPRSALAP